MAHNQTQNAQSTAAERLEIPLNNKHYATAAKLGWVEDDSGFETIRWDSFVSLSRHVGCKVEGRGGAQFKVFPQRPDAIQAFPDTSFGIRKPHGTRGDTIDAKMARDIGSKGKDRFKITEDVVFIPK